jgi:hypothetical protein
MQKFVHISRITKRFTYQPTEVPGDYDVYTKYRGETYLIATIRDRQFKRLKCPGWVHRGVNDLLTLTQSYAALNALESGKTGPV